MNKKSVGVTTFCSWTSYGSMLQAASLHRVLEKLGYDNYILYDRPITLPRDKYRLSLKLGVKGLVSNLLNSTIRNEINSQYRKSNSFIKKYTKIIYYNSYDELAQNYYQASYYLAGSDQVFNPVNPRPGLFLDYVKDKSKLLTYACSMGKVTINPKTEGFFSKYVNNFKTISVREEDNIDIIKKYNNSAEYYCHIDPTFLTTKDEWRRLEKRYDGIFDKYILVYPLYWDKASNKQLKKLHKQGYAIIGVFNSKNKNVYCNRSLYDVGVQEFLWLVDHAEAVVTSSFHGLAFSTIFEKKVSVVINPGMSSRLNHLINLLGIKTCSIDRVLTTEQDYSSINPKIEFEKNRSYAYLKEILHEK